MRLSLLARLTDLEAPLISREIRDLVESGHVRRSADPTDGRAGIVELLNGTAEPASGWLNDKDPNFGSPKNRYTFDPAKGKALLAEAGYTDRKPLSLKVMISSSGSGQMLPMPMNEYLQENLKQACNVDLSENIGRPGRLVDHRADVGANPKCASPFGVQDLAGNLEEWVQADNGKKMGWKEVLKGSWWIPSRHACRQFQVGHNDVYNGAETGTRCCHDLP